MTNALTIGYLAPEGTNGHHAAKRYAAHLRKKHGPDAEIRFENFPTHAEIIEAQRTGLIDFGVVAIDNTLDGLIIETVREIERMFDACGAWQGEQGSWVCWEEVFPIQHALWTQSGTLQGIKEIHSHPSALRQCSKIVRLLDKAREIRSVPQSSTAAGAVNALADATVAAIATQVDGLRQVDMSSGSELVQLGLPNPGLLTDYPNCFTRFWVLGPERAIDEFPPVRIRINPDQDAPPSMLDASMNKTCLILYIPNEVGVLHSVLDLLSRHQLNVAVLYPYPLANWVWEYAFFTEIDGHCFDYGVRTTIYEINNRYTERIRVKFGSPTLTACRVLGSYPNGNLLTQHPEIRAVFEANHYDFG